MIRKAGSWSNGLQQRNLKSNNVWILKDLNEMWNWLHFTHLFCILETSPSSPNIFWSVCLPITGYWVQAGSNFILVAPAPNIQTAGGVRPAQEHQIGAGGLGASGRGAEEGSVHFIGSHLMLYKAHLLHCTPDLPGQQRYWWFAGKWIVLLDPGFIFACRPGRGALSHCHAMSNYSVT